MYPNLDGFTLRGMAIFITLFIGICYWISACNPTPPSHLQINVGDTVMVRIDSTHIIPMKIEGIKNK